MLHRTYTFWKMYSKYFFYLYSLPFKILGRDHAMCKRKLPFAILKAYFLKVMMFLEQNGHKRSSTL